MTDIVERLREPNRGKTEHEAAAEIERLRARVKELEERCDLYSDPRTWCA